MSFWRKGYTCSPSETKEVTIMLREQKVGTKESSQAPLPLLDQQLGSPRGVMAHHTAEKGRARIGANTSDNRCGESQKASRHLGALSKLMLSQRHWAITPPPAFMVMLAAPRQSCRGVSLCKTNHWRRAAWTHPSPELDITPTSAQTFHYRAPRMPLHFLANFTWSCVAWKTPINMRM